MSDQHLDHDIKRDKARRHKLAKHPESLAHTVNSEQGVIPLQHCMGNRSIEQLVAERSHRTTRNVLLTSEADVLQKAEGSATPITVQSRDVWTERATVLRQAAKTGKIMPEVERDFVAMLNEVVSEVDLPPVEIYREKQFDVEPGHVYFEKNFVGAEGRHDAETSPIFRFGSVTRFAEQGRKSDYLGKGMKIGPGIIRETPEYTQGALLHEKTHLSQGEEVGKAEAETRACAEQFKYLYGFSDKELESVVGYYLLNYVDAGASERSCADMVIRHYALRYANSGSRPVEQILAKLQQLRSSLSGYRDLPEKKQPLATEAMDNLIEAVDEALHRGILPTTEYLAPAIKRQGGSR